MNWNDLYRILNEYYGPIEWWTADDGLEVIVGSVLTQNTSWQAVEKALANLKQAGVFNLTAMAEAPPAQMETWIRPAGYYRLKTKRLQNLLKFISDRYGTLENMFSQPLDPLRKELLSVNGIGPETADSILLYAGNFPTFVIDTYTRRILDRHDWLEPIVAASATPKDVYESIRNDVINTLEPHAPTFAQLHGWIVQLAQEFCRKTTPQCECCPLNRFLRR